MCSFDYIINSLIIFLELETGDLLYYFEFNENVIIYNLWSNHFRCTNTKLSEKVSLRVQEEILIIKILLKLFVCFIDFILENKYKSSDYYEVLNSPKM